ncbi:lipopolysaccharide export system protein LptA [Alishewanella longhuensis]|uniref:Lipopolysaccharide export system protein LptA n=1 Tax=Alishewanella longhuensis TaxID=1091037 RepID=A0ABQ3L1Q5_9ALTE|nr:lipopolysaccharide transport periplasmic protein LptA [Alishewanella longhuensis]GHG76651.1 lipopolysaccharide export system protein LptA [Alishewanella longhuensis]
MNIKTLCCCMLLSISTLHAAPADYTQPVDVRSDFWEASIQDNISIYRENVEVRQGSMLIKAVRLEANASAGRGNEVLIASGSPATYSQTLEDGKKVTAQANEIRYDLASRTLTLTGNAEMSQSGSLVQGAVIRYNIATQQLSAESEQNRRVTTIFTPEIKENP